MIDKWSRKNIIEIPPCTINKFEQVWSGLNKFHYFGSSLNQFDQVCLNKFDYNARKSRQKNYKYFLSFIYHREVFLPKLANLQMKMACFVHGRISKNVCGVCTLYICVVLVRTVYNTYDKWNLHSMLSG